MSVGEFWPEKNVTSNQWTLNFRDTAPTGMSGLSVPVPLGEPFWEIEVTVEVPKRSAQAKLWRGFFARREGRRNTFTANRSFNTFPASGLPVPAGASVNGIDRGLGLVNLSSIGAEVLSEGDMISYFTAQNGYYIGEVKGVSAGALVGLEVSPPPFEPHQSTPVFRGIKAVGEFRLNGPVSPQETSSRLSWNFSARQVIRG